jgi:thiol:disulfide interchange protein DsbD
MVLWGILLIASAIYLKALDSLDPDSSGWQKLWKGVGVVLLVLGTLQLIGAAAGGRDYMQPLKGLQLGMGGGAASSEQRLAFKSIKTVDDLQTEIANAGKQGKMVMFDFYADWCVYCKDYEKYVFTDSRVIQALSDVVLLKADVTANDEQDKALLKHVSVTAPPAILFFDKQGTERRGYRVVGSMNADEFLAHVNKSTRP